MEKKNQRKRYESRILFTSLSFAIQKKNVNFFISYLLQHELYTTSEQTTRPIWLKI